MFRLTIFPLMIDYAIAISFIYQSFFFTGKWYRVDIALLYNVSDRGHQERDTRTAWNNPSVPVTSSIIDVPHELKTMTLGISSPTTLSPPSEIPAEDKRHRRKNRNTMLSNPAATVPTCPALASSTTNVPVVGEDHSLHNLRFTKSSHGDDNISTNERTKY